MEIIFADLNGPKVFFANPMGMEEVKLLLIQKFQNLCREVVNPFDIEAYIWELSVDSKDGFEHGIPAQAQIGFPGPPWCRALVCIFGEELGTPINSDYLLKEIDDSFIKPSAGGFYLKPNWQDGDEAHKAFPLTGSVFECLAAMSAGVPVYFVFVGNDKIITGEDPLNAKWGEERILKRVREIKEKEEKMGEFYDWHSKVYRAKLRQLSNFIKFLRHNERVFDPFYDSRGIFDKLGPWLVRTLKYSYRYSHSVKKPCKGLGFYDVDDGSIFLGRSHWVNAAADELLALWNNEESKPFFGVVGGSGVGKSSALRAGLVYRLTSDPRYGNIKALVFSASDFNLSTARAQSAVSLDIFLAILDKCQQVLGQSDVLQQALEILPKYTEVERPDFCVQSLCEALKQHRNKVHKQLGKKHLLIALDQFEELIDVRDNKHTANLLEPFFQFLQRAVENNIAVVYTCQPNRLSSLTQDEYLQNLALAGSVKELEFPSKEDIEEIVEGVLGRENIKPKLARHFIREFVKRVHERSESERETFGGGILPLISLALENIYHYAEEKLPPNEKGSSAEDDFTNEINNGEESISVDLKKEFKEQLDEEDFSEEEKKLLDFSSLIQNLLEKAVEETKQAPLVDWSEDVVFSLLRRMVEFDTHNEKRLRLNKIKMPDKGAARILAQSLLTHRLLKISTGDREEIQFVHQAVIDHWPQAQTWVEQDRELFLYAASLEHKAKKWQEGGRQVSSELIYEVGMSDAVMAEELLAKLTDVYLDTFGEEPTPSNQLLRDYFFAILESRMAPERVVQGRERSTCHFILAATYGRLALLKKYVQYDSSVIGLTRSDGVNAVYGASFVAPVDVVKYLLQSGAEPSLKDKYGWSAIHIAASQGRLEVFSALVDAGVDADVEGPGNTLAIHTAARNGDVDMLAYLLQHYHIDPDARTDDGWTPLMFACRYGNYQTVELLLEQWGADPSAKTKNDFSSFLTACRSGDRWMVAALLKNAKTDPLEETSTGFSALQLAIYNKAQGVVTELLSDPRVDRSVQTKNNNEGLLDLCIKEGRLDILAELLQDPKHKIDPNSKGWRVDRVLHRMARARNTAAIDCLLQYGADPNIKNDQQETPLHLLAELGDRELVTLFLQQKGIAIFEKSKFNRTPLFNALIKKHWSVAQQLLDFGGGINEEGFCLHDLFAYTLYQKDKAMFDFLRDSGADFLIQYKCKRTLLHLASQCGVTDMVDDLVAAGLGIDAQDTRGWQAVHLAAQNGNTSVLKSLLEHGASIDALGDKPVLTPLQAAAETGQLEALKLLLETGANVLACNPNKSIPLVLAIKHSQFDCALFLLTFMLNKGCELNEVLKQELKTTFSNHLQYLSQNKTTADATVLELARQLIQNGVALNQSLVNTLVPVSESAYIGDEATVPETKVDAAFSYICDYPWTLLDRQECESLQGRINPIDGKYKVSARNMHVHESQLPWYNDVNLLRVRDDDWLDGRLYIYYLKEGKNLFRLNGTSPPIHEVNAKSPIQLAADNVLDYLRFFCFFVRGDEGPFYVLESKDDPYVEELLTQYPEMAQIVRGCIRPATFEGKNDLGYFQCSAAIFYSNALFSATFSIQPSGMSEMLNDEPIAADLPYRINVPIA